MIRGRYGYATAGDVAVALALTGPSQFCDMGHRTFLMDGHRVWVTPKVPGKMTLRAMTKCPHCHRELPVGRLAQHERKVHTVEYRAWMDRERAVQWPQFKDDADYRTRVWGGWL